MNAGLRVQLITGLISVGAFGAAFATSWAWIGPIGAGAAAGWMLKGQIEARTAPLVRDLLVWAAVCSAAVITLCLAAPGRAERAVAHGPGYWAEMQPYVYEARGAETEPAVFVPRHLQHLALFAALAAVSGGVLGLMLGAVLTAYMSYYVAQVMMIAERPVVALLMAWHPWALLRVVSFVILGVVLARWVWQRPRLASWWHQEQRAVAIAGGLWLADLGLKTLLAPTWSVWLRATAGISR